ncbi:MAG: hypothetical protein FWG77_08775 [Treponema sp.]|nr:hypothetical protein [Treponema sp.]
MKMLLGIFLALLLTGCCTLPSGDDDPLPLPLPLPNVVTVTEYVYIDRPGATIENIANLQPVTSEMINGFDREGAVSVFQYYLSSPLLMISEGRAVTTGVNNLGALSLSTDFNARVLTVDAITPGRVINIDSTGNRRVLEVVFELPNDNPVLRFIESSTAGGYFDLLTVNGMTSYWGLDYRVRESAEGPTRLMIAIEHDTSPILTRHIPGRVADDRTPVYVEFLESSAQTTRPVSPPVSTPVSPPAGPPAPGPRAEPIRPAPTSFIIQVGAFHSTENARIALNQLYDAGFRPSMDIFGNFHRVFIPGVPQADLEITRQRLTAIGFPLHYIRH